MKKVLLLSSLLSSSNLYASDGFTWVSFITHKLGIHIPEHVLTFLLVGVVLVLFGLIYRSKLSKVPNVVIPDKGITFRNLTEAYGQFIYNQCKSVLGDKLAPEYFPFIASVFIMILCLNLIGLIPGFLPPTEFLSTTFAFGVFSFLYYNYKGCKSMGTIAYLKHFAGPLWYMAILIFPIEILSHCFRPISLSLRLRGNMMGDHMVLGVFSDLVPYLVPIPFYALGLLVCCIQAYVFTMLTMVYINLATSHHDHAEQEAH